METTKRQLKFASAFVVASGLFVSLGAWAPTAGLLRLYGAAMFWPGTEEVAITKEANLLAGILGGVMVSWGIVYWFLTDLLEDSPHKVKQIFLTSIVAWFVTDTLGSIAAGGYVNVLCNIGYLLIFVLPLRRVATSTS